jgi:hypothetical protein
MQEWIIKPFHRPPNRSKLSIRTLLWQGTRESGQWVEHNASLSLALVIWMDPWHFRFSNSNFIPTRTTSLYETTSNIQIDKEYQLPRCWVTCSDVRETPSYILSSSQLTLTDLNHLNINTIPRAPLDLPFVFERWVPNQTTISGTFEQCASCFEHSSRIRRLLYFL